MVHGFAHRLFLRAALLLPVFCFTASAAFADAIEGTWTWSFTPQNGAERQRSLKIKKEGASYTAVVVREDSESPVKDLEVKDGSISFSYEVDRGGNKFTVKFAGKVEGDAIKGTMDVNSTARPWEAKRMKTAAGEGWIELIAGKSPAESGWKLRNPGDDSHKDFWTLKEGVLANGIAAGAHGIDIYHEKNFKDFDLHVEFRIPKGSNSGVYLRGCYEVQVEDTHGKPIKDTVCGAIYGQKAPSEDAALPAGEWQTFDITLKDNKATVIHNGKKVIDGFELKGVTGGARGKHGEDGPIMLQGDHGNVEYKNIRVRPYKAASTTL